MSVCYLLSTVEDGPTLADIRVKAMQPSLQAIGRFDESRARNRFLERFTPELTQKIIFNDHLVGFFVVRELDDHLLLDHLYILPSQQGSGLGRGVLEHVKTIAEQKNRPVRLCALRDSDANRFYQQYGFVFQYEEEWDIHYEWRSHVEAL